MKLPILAYGHSILRQKCNEIDLAFPKLEVLICDMWETMQQAKGCGLAAPQIGQSIRVFMVDSKTTFNHLGEADRKIYFPSEDTGIMETFINAIIIHRLTEKSERIELWMEGSSVCIIENGQVNLEAFKKQNLTYLELFGEMRQQQVEHLGQVKKVYLEPTGEISMFFYENDQVKPGLPIFPELLHSPLQHINKAGLYACRTCGYCQQFTLDSTCNCPKCNRNLWLFACTNKRIT